MQELYLATEYLLSIGNPKREEDNSLTIFVLEDNPVYLDMIQESLSHHQGYKVYTFSHWRDCSNMLYLNPDLVIVDYFLEEELQSRKSGKDFLEMIKEENPETEVAIISNDKKISFMNKLETLGAKKIIVKNRDMFHQIRKMAYDILTEKKSEQKWGNIAIVVLVIMTVLIFISGFYLAFFY